MTIWQRIRAWFKDSEVIALARTWLALGLGVFVSALAGMNWSLFLNTSLTNAQIKHLAIAMIVQGVVVEIARRLRATDLK